MDLSRMCSVSLRRTALLLPLLLGGCSQRYAFLEPEPPVAPPGSYANLPAETAASVDRWWESFGDPELDHRVEAVLSGNLDLRAAWARLSQARAGARVQAASTRATVDLQGQGGRSNLFFGAAPVTVTRYSVSAPAAYEVDLWNELSARTRAQHLLADATRKDVEALALSLVAELVETWVSLREQYAQRDVLLVQLEANQSVLDSIRVRYTQGQSTSLDFYQQEQLVEATRARIELVDAELSRLSHRLSVLQGEAPGEVVLPSGTGLPELPPLPDPGLPADLLQQRPDLRAAFRRIEAADYEVAAALRDRLPTLRLSASYAYQAAEPANLFRSILQSVSAMVGAPLIDGGRRQRTLEQRRAQLEEALHTYGQAFLRALEEVENALVRERQQVAHLEELERQEATTRKAYSIASARYREGAEDFVRVLTSLNTLNSVQQGLVSARGDLLRFRIQLCRALGGGWTGALAPPPKLPEPGRRHLVDRAGAPREETS